MQKVKIVIKHTKASEVIWNELSLATNTEIEVGFSDFLRLRKLFDVDIKSQFTHEYDPSHWKERKTFGLSGLADLLSGFGNCTVNLVRESIKKGYDVRWVGRQMNLPDFAAIARKEVPNDIAMVWHDQPRKEWFESPFKMNIAIVPFETTRIPQSWVSRLNTMDALFVPCAHNVQMMRDSGVVIPIEVIYWGVNEDYIHPIDRLSSNVFTFGTVGSLSIRKGTDVLVKAFQLAFPKKQYPDVRLLCKTSSNVYEFNVNDDRVIVDIGGSPQSEILDAFYRKINCFVLPTRGEGAGLPVVEALGSGVPVITTGWSGVLDYSDPSCTWYIDYRMTHADDFVKIYGEDCGDWAEPDTDSLVELLRHAYNNPNEVSEKGRIGAEWVKNNRLWKDTINTFHTALDKYL